MMEAIYYGKIVTIIGYIGGCDLLYMMMDTIPFSVIMYERGIGKIVRRIPFAWRRGRERIGQILANVL